MTLAEDHEQLLTDHTAPKELIETTRTKEEGNEDIQIFAIC